MKSATNLETPPEAVIISGRRRGQIIRLKPGDFRQESETRPADGQAEWRALSDALDSLNKKLALVSAEVRRSAKALRSSSKKI
jgi:hypothetical protein